MDGDHRQVGVALEAGGGVGALVAVGGRAAVRLQQGYGAERLRGLHADQVLGHRAQVAAEQPRQLHDGQRPAVLAGGRDRGLEQLRAGQRPGAVVDRDHVDLAGLDVLGQGLQRRPLRGVPGGAAGHQPDLAVTQQRGHGLADGVLVAGADAEHQPRHVRDRQRGAHRAGRARWCRRAAAAPCWCPRRPGCRTRRRGSRRRRARANCYMPVARTGVRGNTPSLGSAT